MLFPSMSLKPSCMSASVMSLNFRCFSPHSMEVTINFHRPDRFIIEYDHSFQCLPSFITDAATPMRVKPYEANYDCP